MEIISIWVDTKFERIAYSTNSVNKFSDDESPNSVHSLKPSQ